MNMFWVIYCLVDCLVGPQQRCANPEIFSQSADFDQGFTSAFATGEKYWIHCQSVFALNTPSF